MGDARRSVRRDLNQVSEGRCKTRKETLQQLLKLTNEITANFKKDKGGICKKPLNGFPDPPKRPYARSLPTATLDGRGGLSKYQIQSKRRNAYQQGIAISRGPALNPTVYDRPIVQYEDTSKQIPTLYYYTKQKSGNMHKMPSSDLKSSLKIAMSTDQSIATMAYRAMMKLCDQLEKDVVTSAAGDIVSR